MIRLPIENQSFKERLTMTMRYIGTLLFSFRYDQNILGDWVGIVYERLISLSFILYFVIDSIHYVFVV